MIPDSDLVSYACIAHHRSAESSTILAEFNSADSSVQEIAHQCLHHTPPYHNMFSHSYRDQCYTFLVHDGFVFFGIFDYKMSKSSQVRFLNRLKKTIDHVIVGKSSFKFSSYCLQGEFHPLFHQLMSRSIDFDALHLVASGGDHDNGNGLVSNSSKTKKILSVSLLSASKIGKGMKKKKSGGESREGLVDGKVDMLHDGGGYNVGEVKSREFIHPNGNCLMDSGVGKHKAKKIWRRHVWIVLVLDLAVCLVLFGIWLFVCRGFQCIEG